MSVVFHASRNGVILKEVAGLKINDLKFTTAPDVMLSKLCQHNQTVDEFITDATRTDILYCS